MIQRLKAEFETKELFRIGRKAENEVEQFDFDFTTWQEKYGEGSAVLLVQRNRDDSAYPVPLIIENGIASWVITDTDTAKSGRGSFQLEYVSGTKKKKSDVWHFVCGISLEGTLPAPDPYENWLETITEKTAEVSGYAQDAYQSAEDAEASAASAQTSADSANQSAIDAENSADEAASHANEAKGYRDEAKTYRDEAENAESDVSDLVAEARGYADDANRYQSQASGYADNASASATQASISATNAEASATASANSASEADASADRAEQAKEDILASRPNWEESDSESLSFISNKPSIASGTGKNGIVEGLITGDYANIASGTYSHAEGAGTRATGPYAHAEGSVTVASGNYSHAEGGSTIASGNYSHAESIATKANGYASHSEGYATIASGRNQHVQGKYNVEDTNDQYAHIVGNGTSSARSNAHTLDWSGNAWYSGTVTADGTPTNDNDLVSKKWVEDKGYLTEQAQANWTESDNTSASYIQNKPSIMSGTGYLSIAEGYGTTSSGLAAHSEGMACTASDSGSHAEGRQTEANGKNSHAEGYKTIASGNDSHVQGKFNVEDSDNIYAHIVGNGDSDSTRSNAHTLDWSGNAWYAGKVSADGEITEAHDLTPKSYVDDNLSKAFVEKSASGTTVMFNDGAEMPMKSLVVDIEPVQDLNGYDNPWVGGSGKNLLDANEGKILRYMSAWNGFSFDDSTKTVTITGGALFGFIVPVKPSTQYTYSLKRSIIETLNARIREFKTFPSSWAEDGNFIVQSVNENIFGNPGTQQKFTFTTNAETNYIVCCVYHGNSTPSDTLVMSEFMLSTDESASYSPYENICPITGHTGVTVVDCGVNIWDEEWELGYIDGTTGQPTTQSTSIRSKNLNLCIPNASYYGCFPVTSDRALYLYWYDDDGNFISRSSVPNTTATAPSNARYFKMACYHYGTTYNHDISINYPSTDTDYHPHKGSTVSVNWETEAGTVYGGTIDVVSGLLTVDKATAVFDGTETINNNYFPLVVFTKAFPVGTNGTLICSHVASSLVSYANSNRNTFQFRQCDTVWGVTSASELKTKFADEYANGHPVTVCYPLAEPITYQLSPNEIQSILGYNLVYSNVGDVNVTYLADIKTYVDEKTVQDDWNEADSNSNAYIQNKPSIASGTGIGSIIEGDSTNIASKTYSHAEGLQTVASGDVSHTEGLMTESSGRVSHAEGSVTVASGDISHAEGLNTIASSKYQHVQGQCNIEDAENKYAHIVGNGTDGDNRSNAHTLDWSGNAWYAGKVTAEGIPTESNDLVPKSYADKFLNAFPVDTASGSVASFNDGAELPLKELTVGIDPVQNLNGYDSPWPAGGGKNLLNADAVSSENKYIHCENGNTFTPSTDIEWRYSDYIEVTSGEVLFFGEINAPANGAGTAFYTEQKEYLSGFSATQLSNAGNVWTVPENAKYMRHSWRIDTSYNVDWQNTVYITLNSNPHTFSPYSNICPISGWTESNVWKGGKNLINVKDYAVPNNASANVVWSGNLSGTFTLSIVKDGVTGVTYPSQACGTITVDGIRKYIAYSTGKITVTGNVTGISIYGSNAYARVVGTLSLQLEVGSTASAFEEYHGTPIAIDFGQTVYGGVLDVLTGKLTVDRQIIIVDGTSKTVSNVAQVSDTSDFTHIRGLYTCYLCNINSTISYYNSAKRWCSHFKYFQYSQRRAMDADTIAGSDSRGNVVWCSSTFMTAEEFNGYLQAQAQAGTPVTIAYTLATPIEITLDPHEVESLLGQNTIYADTGDTSVEYRADPTLYISKKIAQAISALS